MFVLGIESSCDETSVGIVDGEGNVLSNIIASQIDIHSLYGGIVPEVASRQHISHIQKVCLSALNEASIKWSDIKLIAVTNGPGLAGSLLVGVNFAKGLATNLNIPVFPVNHMDGHIYAAWAKTDKNKLLDFQNSVGQKNITCLIVSGGHTDLALLKNYGEIKLIGETKDDAAGEAFDKVARILGLRYPGGPEIQKVAEKTEEIDILPRAWMKGTDNFSFSGLKTAVLNKVKKYKNENSFASYVPVLANSFQESVVDVLFKKTINVALRENSSGIILSGGVAANLPLRNQFLQYSPLPVAIPEFQLCTDNGAMIAMAGLINHKIKNYSENFDVKPNLRVGES
ncbi:MAG: tRNA (adenosine(37)-N6)-threonylcarbamoyltransferase complex transferase subunit TsaD [Dehalococcoidia bacterium]|tara:strand:- start:22 stop:1047 length:1026 start_codon:yes stop_codon:yes gene_type:complete